MTVDKYLSGGFHLSQVGKGKVWLIDEAGMMGSKKMEAFLKHPRERVAKVVLIGDTKQFQSIEQGKIFQDLQDYTTVSKAEMTEVKRQESEHAKQVVAAIKNKDFEGAFKVLEEHSSLKEIASRGDRLDQIRSEYIEDHRKGIASVVLTANNGDKNEINKAIREELAKRGAVESGTAFKTYEKKEIDAVSRNFGTSYKEGQVVVFKKDCDAIALTSPAGTGKAKSGGVEGTIRAVDTARNALAIQYYDKGEKRYRTAEVDLKKHAVTFQVYEVVEKKFGAGDKILFTKNDRKIGVSNGETGTVKALDAQGGAIVAIGKEGRRGYREVTLNLNNRGDRGYTYLDHAYCVTNHKSQGSSYQKVIVNADVANQKTNSNAFYVQATRMKQDITIYTNDREKLKEQARTTQDKASTLNPVFGQYYEQRKDTDYTNTMQQIDRAGERR